MNQIQSMKVFVEVIERNGFGRAAKALGIGTASVSGHIASLEAHLGVRLLSRNTRSFALTDEGAEYYKTCKQVLDELFEVEASIKKSGGQPRGLVRVDAIDAYVDYLIQPVLPEFMERYPNIQLYFEQSGYFFDTVQTSADVFFRMRIGPLENSSLVTKPLGHTYMVYAAAPRYLEEYGVPATPRDLIHHNCILLLDPMTGRLWEWVFQENGKPVPLDLPHAFAFTQHHARVNAAINGLGIVYEFSSNILQPLREGKLQIILPEYRGVAPPSHICYNVKHEESEKVQAFVNFMLEKYPPGTLIDDCIDVLR